MKKSYLFILALFASNAMAVDVDQSFVDYINQSLPEYKPVNDSFVSGSYDNTLTFSQGGDLNVTFISEGAGFRNQLGWFVYDNDYSAGVRLDDINTWGVLFDDYSNDKYSVGDTSTISVNEGDSIGFWVAANGYNNNNSGNIWYTVDSMNVDGNHTAQFMVQDAVVWGFEDLPIASGDRDFNDVVFIATATPPNAFGSANIATAPVPGLSSGLFGLLGTLGLMVFGRKRNDGLRI